MPTSKLWSPSNAPAFPEDIEDQSAGWIVDFNDAPGRTKQEVLDLVDDFARWLKEREG